MVRSNSSVSHPHESRAEIYFKENKMANTVPARSKIKQKFTWNAESVFKSPQAWEKELKQITEDIANIIPYQGRLAESPEVLLYALEEAYDLVSRVQIAFMYAGFSY